ncbi:MAG TPA: hypothetical protein VME22_07975 [Solirubrobacteraceae bacterium]|nr:hypothetical protein [Solirubrobacteraceae bacterium]
MTSARELPVIDPDETRRVLEEYYERGWTDGMPVMPVTESVLAEFLAQTARDPDEVLLAMPHLNRACTVRLAAINAAMAGCLPEYFPVVLAAWSALQAEDYVPRAIWQSTTGTATILLVNGPIRQQIGLNSRGNVFGSGYRANATIGRAIRLTAINAFGLRPGELDQATQGNPAKYSACIGENEEESPWPAFHVEHGFDAHLSTVTAMTMRSVAHIEARHTILPEQLALDIAGTISRTGALIHETISACIALGPEHAALFARAGWDKDALRRFVYEHAVNTREALTAVGKDAVSGKTRWRLSSAHTEAVPDSTGGAEVVRVLGSEQAVQIIVAGAHNAGVSAVIETFGPRGGPPAIAAVESA